MGIIGYLNKRLKQDNVLANRNCYAVLMFRDFSHMPNQRVVIVELHMLSRIYLLIPAKHTAASQI